MRINKHDTNGTKPLLGKGELGYDDYTAGGDTGRVYVGNGASNIALAKKSEVDAKVVANAGITAGTATKVTYDANGLVTSGTTLSAGDIPVLDAEKITTGTLPVARGGTGVTTVTGAGSVVLNTSPALVTPNIGIATGTSFNSITGLASVNPIIAGVAAVGTSTLTARQDHVHPVQTSVSGNAGSATKLATARTINGVTFDGSANITVDDATAVKLTGNQTIAGVKTFSSNIVGNITGNSATATIAADSNKLVGKNWYWSGQDGQPTWLWGGSDGANMYVYNPANFSVNYANTAGVANNAIGYGQTWQNVTASRVLGTTYTNSTGKPIMVSFGSYAAHTGAQQGMSIDINGSTIAYTDNSFSTGAFFQGYSQNLTAIVPTGATYQYNVSTPPPQSLFINELR